MRKPSKSRLVKKSVRPPKNVTVYSGTRQSKSSKPKSEKKPSTKVRGAEVSIRQSAAAGQIVYGTFRIGGIYTFIETTQLSSAFVRLGSSNSMVGVSAKTAGVSGNDISIAFTVSGTHSTNTVTVTGNAISVRLRSSGGSSVATANEVVSAINGNGAASTLVKASKAEGNGTGVVDPVAQTFLQYGGGSWLNHVITLACHEISSIDSLYLDDRIVEFGASPDGRWSKGYFRRQNSNGTYTPLVFLTYNLGTENQAAIPDLIGQLPTRWTDAHRQRGSAHAYIITVWDEKRFPQGLPAIAFQVKGKPVFDPRSNVTAFTHNGVDIGNNAALVIADYLTSSKFGMGVDWADIDTTALSDAANVCDELVTLADSTQERRYQIKGVFDTSESPQTILEEMADAIAGDIVYQGGKWRILPGKWRTPTVSLSRDDTRGQIIVSTRRSRRDTFNCVRGTISSETVGNELIDYPTIKVQTYITEDGREIYKDLPLNFVTSHLQAQRIARIRLAQIRQSIVIDAEFTLKALSLQIGDVVTYTDAVYGWTNKAFEVRDFSVESSVENGISCKVILAETAEAIYTWTGADQLALDPAPNTNFPTYTTVEPPTALTLASGTEHLYIRFDGTIFTRMKVSWTASENVYVTQGGSYEVRYKLSISSDWVPAAIVSSETTYVYILDVKDGQQYDVRVRAVSAAGVQSDWVEILNYQVIGKTQPPSNVASISAAIDGFGILLEWQSITDLDLEEYELRYGAIEQAWDVLTATAVRVKANHFFFKTFVAGTHIFHVKAVDTSGNYSIGSATTSLTVTAPGQVESYSIGQVDNNVLVDWDPPTAYTFPISHYNVYKGSDFATATKIGTVGGTFYAYIEKTGGTFTYWVTAVDIAGNEGLESGKTVIVSSPPDYILIDSRDLTPQTATLTRALDKDDGSTFLAPVNTTETWQEHYTTNSKSTVQDFIDAGFNIWLQPTPTSAATAEWTYDLGLVLPQNIISVSWNEALVSGAATVSPRISWRETTSSAWVNGDAGAAQVFATNFRYVKVVLTVTGTSNLALTCVSSTFAKIDTKKQSDGGTGTVTNATSGVSVSFNLNFLDVISIVVTPQSATTAIIPVVDFNDAPNPTNFTVYLYDANGTKVTGAFRWSAIGVVNNT